MVEKPLRVEIVAYAPTVFYHCTHCEVVWRETGFSKGVHEEQVASALPPDLKQDYQVVSDWVRRLFRTHCERVVVKVIDAASLEGFWKTLRHGLWRYPAVIIGGRANFSGIDFAAAEAEISRQLAATPA
ncbi:MAG TPA: hypothetical protein VIK33_18150 [Anaerolineae bacterium]